MSSNSMTSTSSVTKAASTEDDYAAATGCRGQYYAGEGAAFAAGGSTRVSGSHLGAGRRNRALVGRADFVWIADRRR